MLVKSEAGRIISHPIAGTVKRGKTVSEDEALAEELRSSLKDRYGIPVFCRASHNIPKYEREIDC